MRRNTALLGVILCLAVTAFAEEFNAMAFIEKAQQSPFGKTLWGTVELEITNGAPGDYLVKLLQGMRQTLYNDIQVANKAHEEFQNKCKNDLDSLKSQIKTHAANVIESRRIISKSQQKLSWDEVELDNQQRQKAEAIENRAKAQQIREKEAAVYAKKVAELNDALLVLHQGKSLIEQNLHKQQGAFIQVAEGFDSYVQKMAKNVASENYYGRGYVSLISFVSSLIQKAGIQANQGAVAKVTALIQKIIDELEQAKNFEYKAEQERIANYKEIDTIYSNTIETLTGSIAKLTNEIANLKQIISYNTQRITENIRAIQVKGRQQRKIKKECNKEMSDFKKADAKRQADFSLADAALNIIMEHIDEFRKIVLDNAKTNIKAHYAQKL